MSMPAGWYDDPFTDHLQRYWTGDSWTKETRARPDLVTPTPPPVPGAAPSGQRYVNYLVPSIIALICCAWPLAIFAIVFSVQGNSAVKRGDMATALQKANRARLFVILSMILGIIVWIYLAYTVSTTELPPPQQDTINPFSA
ncbi:MAG: CD225/dispanin family protein [Actinomycetota bacterium]